MRLKELYAEHRDQVEFIVVYVREAHPSDKWWLGRSRAQRLARDLFGGMARIDVKEPVTLAQRRRVAASCHSNLFDGVVPVFVDGMGDEVSARYAGKPTRIYLLDREGRVIYNPGIGPFGFNPEHLGSEIESYLATSS